MSSDLDKRQFKIIIDQKLSKSGEKERLKEFLRQRLVECGWREELKAYAKDYIQSKGLEQVSVEQLIQDMTPKGRALVPESVKSELFVRVRRFLNEDP